VAVAASSVSACGTDRGESPGAAVTEDNAATTIARDACAAAFRCCTPGAEVDRFLDLTAATEVDCRTQLNTRLEMQYAELTPSISAGRVFFDSAAANRCVSGLRAATCGVTLLTDNAFRDCRDVYAGTRSLGESCANTDECEQPEFGDNFCDGICMIGMVAVPNGQFCDESTSIYCAEGYCEGNVCLARRAVGGACVLPTECVSLTCTAGSCVAAPPPMNLPTGATCRSNENCASGSCDCTDDLCASLVCEAPICDGV
jgi:hypothetical protein